jgi:hypothetical protein
VNDTPVGAVGGDRDGAKSVPVPGGDSEARDLFVALGKALRAYQLYEENNPVYQRFVSALKESFQKLWKTHRELKFAVEETRLVSDGVLIYSSDNRSDSLAWLLYKDGVREVTLLPGIEEEELERLLSVLHQARFVGPESDDLITILWAEGLQCIRYHYIDYLAEGVVIPEPGAGASPGQLQLVREAELAEGAQESGEAGADGEQADPRKPLSQDSFNPTLYALDTKEMEHLQQELTLEMNRDLRSAVLNALFDRLEERGYPQRQSEIISILRTLLPSLLGRGAIEAAARVLQELQRLEARPDVFDQERKQEVSRLLDEVSSPEVIGELVHALEDGSIAAAPRQLGEFLMHLRAQALSSLLRASETIGVRELQPVLRSAVGGIAQRNRAVLVELVSSSDPLVAAGAARLAGSLQVTEAAPALQELLKHPEPAARIAAIDAAVMLKASIVAGALQEALTDRDRSVRIAVARALGQLRYRPSAPRFRALLTGKEIRSADITEKIAFFEGYGELGDPEAVGLLDKLLNGKGLLGRRESAEVRAAAALALGKVGSPDARRALDTAKADEDAVVRSAVNRALREASDAARS